MEDGGEAKDEAREEAREGATAEEGESEEAKEMAATVVLVEWWAALVVEGCTALSLPRRVDCALAVMRRRLDTPPQRSLRCSPHVGGRRAVLRGLLARR